MSNWIEVTDPEDIEIDGEDINILYETDSQGNNYIHLKKELIIDLLSEQTCKGCGRQLGSRYCSIGTIHCVRMAEDYYIKEVKK